MFRKGQMFRTELSMCKKEQRDQHRKEMRDFQSDKNVENYLLDTNRKKSQEISTKMQPEGELKSVYTTH